MNSEDVMCVTASKETLCAALYAFIAQRSGIEFRNYWTGDYWNARSEARQAFNGDYRPILKHGRHARQMLRYVELSGITAESLVDATRAYSGRLQFNQREDGKVAVEYTTGQYFPTEYRKAACAVLAQAIWDHWRKDYSTSADADKLTCGEYITKTARRNFGRSIASTWFN